ncbi:surface protease GP63 [Trypanosoma theileri]|uniref:Leishmanolysin-like peptidase n=1 Tax=Trypanosoma theileri TaxID=67003 RepID=A0A1X0P3K0_9TRYP|nr:surface protease GP63 [Trypanosoma theileri]ORC91502.1 surface protease GP63 [Trypanosoma theileri]
MEKHSMRHLLWTALFLLYCSCGCLAAVVQQLPQKGENALQAYTVSTPSAPNGEEWKPIRIAVYTKYVEDVMNYCIAEKKEIPSEYNVHQGLKNDLESQFKQLCEGENKMTTKRMHTLFKEVLPQAIKLHRDRLKVKPMKDKLKLWKEDYYNTENIFGKFCQQFFVPEEHVKDGVSDADFLLYVRLSPYGQDSHICTYEDYTKVRPTSARISFVPKEINATRHYIRLAARNIAFGLGFGEFVDATAIAGNHRVFLNGGWKQVTVVTGGALKEKMNQQFNCSETGGIPLDFKDTNYISQWERRIAKDELMSPYTGEPTGMFYTALTLAVFDTRTYYQVDFSMAEPMSWGNQSGCELFKSKCQDIIEKDLGNLSKTFCKESKDEPTLQCTSDRFGLGVCSKDDNKKDGMPAEYNYFKKNNIRNSDMMEGCPIIKPFQETMCETGNETLMPGSIVSNMSRCLDVEDPKFVDGNNGIGLKVQGICAKVKCENDKVLVHYKGQNDNGKEKWHTCENDGQQITLEGSVFSGGTIIRCPKYAEVCTKETNTDLLPEIKYNVVQVPEDEDLKQEKREEEAEVQSNSSTNPEVSGGVANAGNETPTTGKEESSSTVPDVNGSSQQPGTATQSVIQHTEKNSTNAESDGKEVQHASRSRRHIADATASQSTSNPNGTEDPIQSPNTVLNGTTITERQIKEETLKHTNVTVMFGTDSSTVVTYMAPLALLVCVVGFVMVP